MSLKRVVIESPYAGKTEDEKARNVAFARACMKHSFEQSEAPFLSHLLYPQVLDDDNPEERMLGIEAGLLWGAAAEASIVYPNLGISYGMKLGIRRAVDESRIVIERVLPGWTWPPSGAQPQDSVPGAFAAPSAGARDALVAGAGYLRGLAASRRGLDESDREQLVRLSETIMSVLQDDGESTGAGT